jgi:hypothetical protein
MLLGAILLVALNACLIDIKDLRSDAAGAGGSAGGGSGTTSGGEGGSVGGSAPCPAGMVHAHHAAFAGISFCIDATEVTERRCRADRAAARMRLQHRADAIRRRQQLPHLH